MTTYESFKNALISKGYSAEQVSKLDRYYNSSTMLKSTLDQADARNLNISFQFLDLGASTIANHDANHVITFNTRFINDDSYKAINILATLAHETTHALYSDFYLYQPVTAFSALKDIVVNEVNAYIVEAIVATQIALQNKDATGYVNQFGINLSSLPGILTVGSFPGIPGQGYNLINSAISQVLKYYPDVQENTIDTILNEKGYMLEFASKMAQSIRGFTFLSLIDPVGENNNLKLLCASIIDFVRAKYGLTDSENAHMAVEEIRASTRYKGIPVVNRNILHMDRYLESKIQEFADEVGVKNQEVKDSLNYSTRVGDPILIKMSQSKLSLTDIHESSIYFDYDNLGFAERTGWVGSDIGILVSQKPDGIIHPFTGNSSSGDGFAELNAIDTDGDGKITSLDIGFSSLYVWMDLNKNGKVDTGELLSMADAGISSIGLAHSNVSQNLEGNTVTGIGSVTMTDGTQRDMYDVNFQVDTMDTQAENLPSLTADIEALPQLHGYGQLMDLRSSMVGNASLKASVEALVSLVASSTADVSDLRSALRDIMLTWASVGSMDPTSRGGVIDARRISFIEKYIGQAMHFMGYYGMDTNPGMLPSLMVNQGWERIEANLLGGLLVQTDTLLSQHFDYDEERGLVVPKTDLETDLGALITSLGTVSSSNLDTWTRVAAVLSALQNGVMFDDATFADILASYGTGMKDMGILVTAVTQGLDVSFDSSGTLHVSNSPSDGILDTGYGRNSGLSLVYEPGDGSVQVDFSNPSWLSVVQGWAPNTIHLGMDSKDATSTILSDGTMVISDGRPGDALVLPGEALGWVSYQRGVQEFIFQDGVHWHGPRVTAMPGQTAILPSYAGVTYDTAGYASDVTTTGDGNTLAYAKGYGAVAYHVDGVNEGITLSSSIGRADVVMTIDPTTNMVSITDGTTGDSISIDNNWYNDYRGSQPRVSTINFADGSSASLGGDMPFTWYGTPTTTTLSGTDLGRNRFVLGAGGDTVTGGARGNTFVMGPGIGHAIATLGGGADTVEMASGISASDVLLQSDAAGDLVVAVQGYPDDTLTLLGDLSQSQDGTHSKATSILFQDGTLLFLGVGMQFTWQPVPGTMVTGSGWGANTFLMSQNVHYVGGAGQQGGSIENTYVMDAAGIGQSTIDSRGSWSTLVLPEGISRDDVVFRADNDTASLIVAFKDRPDTITVQGGLFAAWGGIGSSLKSIRFADGTSMDVGLHGWGQGSPITFTEEASTPGQHLVGSLYGPNTFVLAPGDDTVVAGNANRGGSYDNTFIYHRGDGHVAVNMDSALGYVRFGAGISASDVLVQDGGDHHLVFRLRGDPGDVLDISNAVYQVPWGVIGQVRNMTFDDGTQVALGQPFWGLGQPLSFTWQADASHLALAGSGYGSNVFELAPGGDTVVAGNGSMGGPATNTFLFGLGDGHAHVDMAGGTGILVLGAGILASDVLLQAHDDGSLVVALRGHPDDSISFSGSLYGRAGSEVGSRLGSIILQDGTLIGVGASDTAPHNALVSTWTEEENGSSMTGSRYGDNVFETGTATDILTTGDGSLGGKGFNTVIWSGQGDVSVHVNGNKGVVLAEAGSLASATFERLYGVQGSSAPVQEGSSVPAGTRGDISVGIINHTLVLQGDIVRNPGGSTSTFSFLSFAGGDTSTLDNVPTYTWAASPSRADISGRDDGNNVFMAGASTNSFTGGAKENQYVFGHGDGAVSVTGRGTFNDVAFKTDVTMADVRISLDGSHQITALLDGTTDSIHMSIPLEVGEVGGLPRQFELSFADGTNWTDAQVRQLASGDVTGTNGADLLEGVNALLQGMGGPDNYIFRSGDGAVSIVNGSSSDAYAEGQLDLGAGMTASTMWLSRAGDDLVLQHMGDSQSVKVDGWFSGQDSARLAYVRGYDGDYLDTRQAGALDGLIGAMSAYSAAHTGFSLSALSTMPIDATLQSAVSNTWHHPG